MAREKRGKSWMEMIKEGEYGTSVIILTIKIKLKKKKAEEKGWSPLLLPR